VPSTKLLCAKSCCLFLPRRQLGGEVLISQMEAEAKEDKGQGSQWKQSPQQEEASMMVEPQNQDRTAGGGVGGGREAGTSQDSVPFGTLCGASPSSTCWGLHTPFNKRTHVLHFPAGVS
jgi:hypothetical protein